MKRSLLLVVALWTIPSFAGPAAPEPPPTPQQQLSQAKIQIGQLLVMQGNLELQVDKLQSENEVLKKQVEASKNPPKQTPTP